MGSERVKSESGDDFYKYRCQIHFLQVMLPERSQVYHDHIILLNQLLSYVVQLRSIAD